jgi:hypothetical protein
MMSKRLAICCLAVVFLASVPPTPALPQGFGFGFTAAELQSSPIGNLGAFSPGISNAANISPGVTQQLMDTLSGSRMEPVPTAVPQSAPITQDFIQLAQPEVETPYDAGYSPSSAFSELQMQPDFGDSDVSEDDGD